MVWCHAPELSNHLNRNLKSVTGMSWCMKTLGMINLPKPSMIRRLVWRTHEELSRFQGTSTQEAPSLFTPPEGGIHKTAQRQLQWHLHQNARPLTSPWWWDLVGLIGKCHSNCWFERVLGEILDKRQGWSWCCNLGHELGHWDWSVQESAPSDH
jgi:hypothetical protein